jgi:hypothetical protein
MYDNVKLDQTDAADTTLIFKFSDKPKKIAVTDINIYPTNMGEPATYAL